MERAILIEPAARGAAALAAILAAGLAGCLGGTSFTCERDDQCTGSPAGRCEANGYCSFPDEGCASGSRFGEHSGPLAGQCIDATAGIDARTCPPAYAALPGVTTHLYRLINTAAAWSAQSTACSSEGAYLVEPDTAAELDALKMRSGGNELWVGISDLAREGTYLTTRLAAPAYLPWEAGQPDDAPTGADCVRLSATATYADERCITTRRAACECEP